jgi:hypothetical protein
MVMAQIIASIACLLLLATSALAESGNPTDSSGLYFYGHLAATAFGLIFAIRMANEAFGRRAFPLADTPTFPRYMTSRGQYLLGSGAFILFACFVFLLLVFLHKEVVQVMETAGVPLPKAIFEAVKTGETPYLMIIFAMGIVYLYLLQKEASWNVLLWMRDLIQSWISVPQLGRKIVYEIQYALKVPAELLDEIMKHSVAVSKGDFAKDRKTIDRMWAELSYLRWWILERRSRGDDTTFFGEQSFSPDELLKQYDDISQSVGALKAGKLQRSRTAENVHEDLKPIHRKFCRLVACYLLYKNGSRQRLALGARRFGIPFTNEEFDNPLRYSIIFILTVFAAVNVGVFGSAVIFDLLDGQRLLFALSHQDFDRILNWTMYALSNYGLAIVVVLAVRLLTWSYAESTNQSRLLTYCWTFVLACAVGPLGLSVTAKLDAHSLVNDLSPLETYYFMLRWGVGPGLVAVCISYFMDRQLSSELPNIDTSEMLRRLLNSIAFACFTIILQLPQLLAATGDPGWTEPKLRSVAVGTTFIVTLALAVVAQFGLRKPRPDEPAAIPVSTPAE